MCLDESLMTERTDHSLGEEHRLSRRRMIKTSFGAVAGIVAVGKVAGASLPGGLSGAAGPLENGDLQPAVRIPPPTTTTTLPPIPDGQIMFPIDAREGECWISDNFGDCRGSNCSRRHEGLDISGNRGADLFAVVTGVLTNRYDDRGLTYGAGNGWTLYDETTNITYKYFHNTPDANGFEVGDRVEQGDIIGFVGDTGTAPGNFHLHFEYRPGNVPADPYHLLQRQEHVLFW